MALGRHRPAQRLPRRPDHLDRRLRPDARVRPARLHPPPGRGDHRDLEPVRPPGLPGGVLGWERRLTRAPATAAPTTRWAWSPAGRRRARSTASTSSSSAPTARTIAKQEVPSKGVATHGVPPEARLLVGRPFSIDAEPEPVRAEAAPGEPVTGVALQPLPAPAELRGRMATKDIAPKNPVVKVGEETFDYVDRRTGLKFGSKWFLFRNVPAETSWFQTLGFTAMTLFGMQAITGIILAMYYTPEPRQRLPEHPVHHQRRDLGLAGARHAQVGRQRDDRGGLPPHGPGLLLRRLQVPARADLAHRGPAADPHDVHGPHRLPAGVGPEGLLGDRGGNEHHGERADRRPLHRRHPPRRTRSSGRTRSRASTPSICS